ncbi:Piso0_005831 [Millerozyma farinosa CBS 7064]|uniref:Piso0_005831 protein n=1 Tax=Pichia sorbitophila (strain ATCC MYA-4447 / BCRC 22081 / CBS 7064 / NBRC 10061 / NRRL Y-12695) TaxID=559304 RepID=G8Y025_PICSO|nr:Piso0_005831 [Millerozyma farinosa CBS 7064]
MKFGKYLASRQLELPEYSGHFIDYKALKKLMKQLAIPDSGKDINEGNSGYTNTSRVHETLKENKASFFFRVERELDKVNAFYLEKQADLTINLNLLIMKKDELFAKSSQNLKRSNKIPSVQGSANGIVSKSVENDPNFRNSISYLNLYQNFKKIHQDFIRLQQFIELNETGFSKVVKKWDKRSKSHTKELFISTAVSVQPVFHKNEINVLSDLVTQSLFELESVLDGDYSVIVNHVEKGLQGNIYDMSSLDTAMKVDDENHVDGIDSQNKSSSDSESLEIYHSEIDELYNSFVNVAILKDPDLSVLSRWVEEVKTSTKKNDDHLQTSNTDSVKYKLSKIFLLSITNLKISDSFLQSFLELINYELDFAFARDDFNNGRNVLHECCSIPCTSTHDSHVTINNGVKVLHSNDSVNHSRIDIVRYMMDNLPETSRDKLLIGKDFNGRSCLHYASQNNRLDMINIIAPYFPTDHIDDLDKESMTSLLFSIRNNNYKMVQKLVEMGSNCYPSSKDNSLQYLPINYACMFGDAKTIEFLLSNCSPVSTLINKPDFEGLLPLHVVARSGHYNLIELLINYGADINKFDGLNKWTPLFYAVLEGNINTAKELIRLGARVDLVDDDSYNVLYYAVIEGHVEILNILLNYLKENPDISMRKKVQAQISENPLISDKDNLQYNGHESMAILDETLDSEDSASPDKGHVDTIPDLKLPPPILPLRRYGHNFLEQKVLIELIFPPDNEFIRLFNTATNMKPGRLTITSNISDMIPRNILLPVADTAKANNHCIFQTDLDFLDEFKVDFEIFPKFGTRLIAKSTALSFLAVNSTSAEINSVQLPLFDLRLKNIGEIKFNYQVIRPFSGTLLETSKFDTYWKSSTSFVEAKGALKLNAAGGLSPKNFFPLSNTLSTSTSPTSNAFNAKGTAESGQNFSSSIVTATSLHGEYLTIKVCFLNDGTPVVCPHWSIWVTEEIDLLLPNLSVEQLSSITESLFDYNKIIHDLSKMTNEEFPLLRKLLKVVYLPLDMFLEILNLDINLGFEIIYPSSFELTELPFATNTQSKLNDFIDFTLNDIFNHIRSHKLKNPSSNVRSIIFLSSNSMVCKVLNWKQPNFPVFLMMSGFSYDAKKQIFESKSTNGLSLSNLKNNDKSKGGDEIRSESSFEQEIIIRSVKEAVSFTLSNNLMGVIMSVYLLKLVPRLIPLIRSRGLILIATGEERNCETTFFDKDLDPRTKAEINGFKFDDLLCFKDNVSV